MRLVAGWDGGRVSMPVRRRRGPVPSSAARSAARRRAIRHVRTNHPRALSGASGPEQRRRTVLHRSCAAAPAQGADWLGVSGIATDGDRPAGPLADRGRGTSMRSPSRVCRIRAGRPSCVCRTGHHRPGGQLRAWPQSICRHNPAYRRSAGLAVAPSCACIHAGLPDRNL